MFPLPRPRRPTVTLCGGPSALVDFVRHLRHNVHVGVQADEREEPMTKMPRGFHTNTYEENLVCPHRDISCCGDCASAHDEIVEVYGLHYWISDPAERAELVRA